VTGGAGIAAAPRIIVDENPAPGLRDQIGAPLRVFNISQVGPINVQALAILLRNPESDEIVGGLWGQSVADWLFVDLLVVPEASRKRGIGTSLLRQAEDVARKRNCVGVWLSTGTFQAPVFYEKLGYEQFGQIADLPRGHKTFFYSKRLDQ
jgi:GNAT superfamily N-acetyltransferase